MLYTSPFEILDLPGTELQQMDRKVLLLKKKQLLAELELQNGSSIVVKDKEFTKNDILSLFEQIEDGGAVEYHAAVAADPMLLSFLQKGILKPGQKFSYNELYQDAGFIEFISPFYKAAFNQFVLKAVAASNYDTTGAVFSNPVLLNGTDYDECLGKLHGYLEEKLHGFTILKNSFAANKYTDISSLHSYYIYDWVLTLNSLPDAFSGYREDYAVELYNFVVDLWNGKKRDEATAMLYGIQNIKTEGNVKKLIADLLDKVSAAQQPADNGGGVNGGRVVWAIISIVLVLLRVASTCNRNSSSSNYNSYNNYPIYNNRYNEGLKTGYLPFSPSNSREDAVLAVLNTLQHSTVDVYKNKKKVSFKTGDDPYKALFAKPVFKPIADTTGSGLTSTTTERPPMIVKDTDDPDITVTESGNSRTSAISALQLNNKLALETILFFISDAKVFSVYLAPNSSYTIQLSAGTYHVFGYSGTGFGYGLPVNNKYAESSLRKSLTGIGRFGIINSKMLQCLEPKNNIHLIAGYTATMGDGSTPAININFDETEYFSIQSGKGITTVKTFISNM
jgi:hypothetical protein